MKENTLKKLQGRVLADPSDLALYTTLSEMPVGGITPFTTIDFPGQLAGVLYLQGCPWRCRYCHNSELWALKSDQVLLSSEKILGFLRSRRGRLDGIVFSGGEPTIHESIGEWMTAVRSMGYRIGLHTNGMYPDRLKQILPLCDWIGMDIKTFFDDYEKVTRVENSGFPVKESVKILAQSSVSYECRTTVHPDLLKEESLIQIAQELRDLGIKEFHVQKFRREGCPDLELRESSLLGAVISADLQDRLRAIFPKLQVRG